MNKHSNIKQDVLAIIVLDDPGKHLPGVEIGIAYKVNLDRRLPKTETGNHTFQEMVETSVTAAISIRIGKLSHPITYYVRYVRHLELRPYSQRSTSIFRDSNALNDSLSISLKIESPLVE